MLKYNAKIGAYVLTSDDADAAKAAGLTLSTRIRGPNGEKVWYTANYAKEPEDNPYAALPFFDQADSEAREKLARLKASFDASWAKETSFDPPHPPGTEFRPFQRAGIEYAVNHHNCLIGDQPGLGKTMQAIGVANCIEAQRVLVVCPASIRTQWQKNVQHWSTLKRPTTYPILKAKDGVSPYANYTIISYDLTRNEHLHEALCDIDWDLLVLDEAHYLKTPDAKRTRAAFGGGEGFFRDRGLADKARRIVGLSGTPLPNRPRECYTLARALDWEAIDWLSEDLFSFRYNPSVTMPNNHQIEARGRLPELQARLRCNFMVRRKKRDVLDDLPDVQYEFTYVEPNGGIRAALAREALLDFDPQDLFNPDFMIDGDVSTVRREMGEAMAPRVSEYVRYLLDIVEVPKVVLAAHHRSVIAMLTEALNRYGVIVRHGGVSPANKQRGVDEFVSSPDLRVFLSQLDTLEGADGLQDVADYVVVAEPAWTPGRNEQVVDRLWRMGQHANVMAQFMLVEGSFNEKVLNTVLVKAHDTDAALDRRLSL